MENATIILDNNFVAGAILTDLSEAFDCLPHNLLIAELSVYNFSDEALSYIYSYLTNRRQCVRINNTNSQLESIISVSYRDPFWGRFFSTYQ